MADYNGWTNYETWAVNLWMDNEQGSQAYWAEQAREQWNAYKDGKRVDVLTPSERARREFADLIRDAHDDDMPETVSDAVRNTVFADLLNAALASVNWMEIADSWLENAELDGYEPMKARA